MKSIKWSAIVIALVYIGAGAYFLLYPETTEEMLCTILGFTLIGIGLINVFSYFIRNNEDSFFRDDFKNALILITIGSFALAYKPLFIDLIYAVIGIIIMISGYGKLQDCVDTWRFGSNHGPLYIIMAFVSIAMGLVVAINPFVKVAQLHMVIAVGLIFSGVSDFISSIYLSTKLIQQRRRKREEEEEETETEPEVPVTPVVEEMVNEVTVTEPETVEPVIEEKVTEEKTEQ